MEMLKEQKEYYFYKCNVCLFIHYKEEFQLIAENYLKLGRKHKGYTGLECEFCGETENIKLFKKEELYIPRQLKSGEWV